jgi:galactose mutarotase-like enzyme
MAEALIGGAPALTLRAPPPPGRAGIVEATVLPGRGFMLLQAVAQRPGGERLPLLHAPSLEAAAQELNGGPDDFAGNRSFAFGGALLAPFANRIRGRPLAEAREIETEIDGQTVRLPRNWGGRAPGAEAYAMHGLMLARGFSYEQLGDSAVRGRLKGFGPSWPGELEVTVEWRLRSGGLDLRLAAQNVGDRPTRFGAGWHPYFRLSGGDRREARLRLPARLRAEVNNYDEVLPTGRLLEVAGTPYDFQDGRALGDLYLDDCFTGLAPGPVELELKDPGAGLGLRITTQAPPVQAVQVYAPPDEPFVVIEPQFNLADPFGGEWPEGLDTGMARLAAGEAATYQVSVSLSSPTQL